MTYRQLEQKLYRGANLQKALKSFERNEEGYYKCEDAIFMRNNDTELGIQWVFWS